MKKTSKTEKDTLTIDYDPIVECAWLPDREVKLSEYNKMITHFVQNYNKEETDAIDVCIKEFTNRSK
tara:strand:- start:425 stop:625 length:201 start_codon:yes stop_codon:yes gene_type:complete